jgi:uncharacterized protein (UPF0210 family)
MRKLIVMAVALAACGFGQGRPKVRAVTAFIRIDPARYEAQYAEAMTFLKSAADAYRAAGFEVEGARIATQPFPEYIQGMKPADAVAFLRKIDATAKRLGFRPSIGPAMLRDSDDTAPLDVLAKALETTGLNASLVIADESGIHWRAVREAAKLIHRVGAESANGRGNLNFAAIAMVKPFSPFYPGAWHTGQGKTFAVGLESANVVMDVFAATHDPVEAEKRLAAALGRYGKEAEAVATAAAAKAGWTYAGLDPTPAPLGDVSIGKAIESFVGGPFGSSGTMTAASVITRAVKSVAVKQTGYSGLMVPILEDNVLAKRWAEGAFSVDSLLAYSSVCAAGLDTVPLRGDTTVEQIAKILGDVASLAFKWQKPLAARLLPVPGGKPGQKTNFGDERMTDTVIR